MRKYLRNTRILRRHWMRMSCSGCHWERTVWSWNVGRTSPVAPRVKAKLHRLNTTHHCVMTEFGKG